jgi:hypothetical protein
MRQRRYGLEEGVSRYPADARHKNRSIAYGCFRELDAGGSCVFFGAFSSFVA